MPARNVDVMDKAGKVLRTYPIALPADAVSHTDADYEKAALRAAKTAKLVPDVDFGQLKARMHIAAANA